MNQGISVGDWVSVKITMHTGRDGYCDKSEMIRTGRVMALAGGESAIVEVNMKQYANGDWKREERLCRLSSLSPVQGNA